MSILLQSTTYTLGDFSGFIGTSIVQGFGGSLLLLGLGILLVIGILSWRLNLHLTSSFFIGFIALTFLRLFMNPASSGDIGLFGTLYNLMLLGMALITANFIISKIQRS